MTILEWSAGHGNWVFQRSRANVSPTEISGATFLVAVSMRNPSFSNDWLLEVAKDIGDWNGRALLTLVDLPYLASIQVLSDLNNDLVKQLAIFDRQRSEQAGRLRRMAAAHAGFCTYVSWGVLAESTPEFLKQEIRDAFTRKGRAYELIILQVRRVFDHSYSDATVERLATFFIQEVPTLLYIYFHIMNGCIDVYPGPQAEFFWELDSGHLSAELPRTSEFVLAGQAHTYANVTLRSDS